jgi:cysteine desulfurase/selenocysteine lyase
MTTIETATKVRAVPAFAVERIRADFPILKLEIGGKPLVYLDNAASSQMPQQVIDRMVRYQTTQHANVNRGVHYLSETATSAFEEARGKVQRFINAREDREVIFTSGTTDAINAVTYGYGRKFIGAGDEIILTTLEHHSNIVPWQMLASQTGVEVHYIPVTDEGLLDMDAFGRMLTERVKLVAVTHMSNVVGTVQPIRAMADAAHAAGALILVDGAQSVPHIPVDVRALDCDFFAFSAHKMVGPTGIGVLYGKRALLEAMPPFMGGGDMIKRVELGGSVWNDLPYKFEAGTPAIAEAIGLGAAVDYLSRVGMENIHAHEVAITAYALDRLAEVPGVRVLGPAEASKRGGLAAFTLEGTHPHDVAEVLNYHGVAVRAGHHCAMPLHQRYDVVASTRASFYLYNTLQEIDGLIDALYKVKETFTA